jgi:hypothetical protein
MILKAAGRKDVCSVCGDDPAFDYKLVAPKPHTNAVATMRLCDDCRMIREAGGEVVFGIALTACLKAMSKPLG